MSTGLAAVLHGTLIAIALSLCAAAVAFLAAVPLVVLDRHGGAVLRTFLRTASWIVRSVPPLVTLLVAYFVLPAIGIAVSPFAAAVIACSIFTAAYFYEIFRAALRGVPASQAEAARALGLPELRVLHLVLLPQMLRIALPPLAGQLTILVKETSLASAISVPEIMFATQGQIYAGANPLAAIGLAGGVYAVTNCALLAAIAAWENRVGASARAPIMQLVGATG